MAHWNAFIIWRPVKKPINEPLNEPLKVKVGNVTTQSVFEVIDSNPGIKQKDLCDQMGISSATAKRHLALLDEFIEHRGSKRQVVTTRKSRNLLVLRAVDADDTWWGGCGLMAD